MLGRTPKSYKVRRVATRPLYCDLTGSVDLARMNSELASDPSASIDAKVPEPQILVSSSKGKVAFADDRLV